MRISQSHSTSVLTVFLVCAAISVSANAQDHPPNADKLTTWLILQAVPSSSWTTFPDRTNYALEWEFTPLLYSFGITKLVSPWNSFFVIPTARFTGSVEVNVSGQIFTSKLGGSHFGFSGQVMGYLPLIERGEYLTLNLGAARYQNDRGIYNFGVVGMSTFFGILHYNLKYDPSSKVWMNAIEFRLF